MDRGLEDEGGGDERCIPREGSCQDRLGGKRDSYAPCSLLSCSETHAWKCVEHSESKKDRLSRGFPSVQLQNFSMRTS